MSLAELNPQHFIGHSVPMVWAEAWVVQGEAVIVSLGLQLADLERESNGLLRISLDAPEGVSVEDCEKVSHQLGHLFMVENVGYERLEVSSPGLDRNLRRLQDFQRFVGREVTLRLKQAQNNQKQFKGLLQLGQQLPFALHWQSQPGQPLAVLEFDIAQLAAARLVPQFNMRSVS